MPAPSIENLLARGEECENASGRHLRFRRPIAELLAGCRAAIAGLSRSATPARTASERCTPSWRPWPAGFRRARCFWIWRPAALPARWCFWSGLVWQDGGVLVLDQLFARNYAEERAVLETLWQIAGRQPRAGDVQRQELRLADGARPQHAASPGPRSRGRARAHVGRAERGRRPSSAWDGTIRGRELVHCDLLHHARRRWKRVLPNCKLQTLERYVCRRVAARRPARGPGAGGVSRVRAHRRDAASWATILHHNALDLVTLVELACRLLAARERRAGPRRASAAIVRAWPAARSPAQKKATAASRWHAAVARCNQTSSPMRRRSRCEKSEVRLC